MSPLLMKLIFLMLPRRSPVLMRPVMKAISSSVKNADFRLERAEAAR
jgi:hypothetical protein